MKKISVMLVALAIAFSPLASFATGDGGYGSYSHYKKSFKPRFHSHQHNRYCGHKLPSSPVTPPAPVPTPVTDVPEINAGGAALAFTLLSSLLLVARERRRKLNS